MSVSKSRSTGKATVHNKPNNRQMPEWKGYINTYLTDSQKAKAADWYTNGENVGRAVEKLLLSGKRLSLKKDASSEAIIAIITESDPTSPDAGFALTERAADWYKALCRVLYIHWVVLDGNWENARQYSFDDDNW